MANITQINGLKITAESASYATTAQNVLGSITSASYAATASLLLGSVPTASLAFSASTVNTQGIGTGTWYPMVKSSISTGYFTPGFDSKLSWDYNSNNLTTTASWATTALTSSLALRASGSLTGSLLGTSSWATNASTASYVVTAQTASYVTGSVYNSANPALSASYAVTASFITTSQTASYVLNAVSSSFAATASLLLGSVTSASFASTASYVNPLVQNVIITGSTFISSSNDTQLQVGSNLLFVSRSGNVGIGTASPTYRLEVQGGDVRFANGLTTGTVGVSGFQFSSNTITSIQNMFIGIDVAGNRSFNITNTAFSTYYLRVAETTGNVIIGTQTDSGAKLYVSGSTSAALLRVDSPTVSGSLFVSGSGNVGVGTTIPSYTLTVKQPSNSTATGFQITQADGASTGMVLQFISNVAIIKNRITGDLTLGTNDSERLRITSTGNIGVGTSAPTAQFHVSGSSGSALLIVDSPASSNIVYVSGSGNVGIGTSTPAYKLDVSGSIRIQGSDRTLYTQAVTNTTADGYLYFGDSTRIGTTGGSNIHYASGYYSQAAHQFYGGTAAGMTSVVDIYGGQSGKPALRVSGSTQITGSLDVSGSGRFINGLTVTGSLIATSFTGSLLGTASYATQALSASWAPGGSSAFPYVGDAQITGSLLVTGSSIMTGQLTIASSSQGPNENTITLGARDAVNEGGQIGFNAPGGTYISASFIDLYQNRLRVLKGTNAGSTGEVASWNMHTLQAQLPAYTSTTSFTGSAVAGLGVDSSGNIVSSTRTGRYGSAASGSTIGTGVTAQTIVYSQLIPANTFSAGNIFRTYFRFRKLATNGNATYNILVNTTNAVAGATTLATLTANTVHNHMKRDFYIAQGNATTSVGSGVSLNTDDTSNTQTLSTITWSSDQYLIYTVTLNTLDSGYGLGYTIEQVL